MGSAKTPSIFHPSAASIARGLRIVGGHWLSRKAVGLPRAIAVLKVLRGQGNRGAIDAERQLRKVTVTSVVTENSLVSCDAGGASETIVQSRRGPRGVPNFIARPR